MKQKSVVILTGIIITIFSVSATVYYFGSEATKQPYLEVQSPPQNSEPVPETVQAAAPATETEPVIAQVTESEPVIAQVTESEVEVENDSEPEQKIDEVSEQAEIVETAPAPAPEAQPSPKTQTVSTPEPQNAEEEASQNTSTSNQTIKTTYDGPLLIIMIEEPEPEIMEEVVEDTPEIEEDAPPETEEQAEVEETQEVVINENPVSSIDMADYEDGPSSGKVITNKDKGSSSVFGLYIGLSQMPLRITGYRNAVLNDAYQNLEQTGRDYVEFENGNVNNIYLCLYLGLYYNYEKHRFIGDILYTSLDSLQGFQLKIGYGRNIYKKGLFSLHGYLKAGFSRSVLGIDTLQITGSDGIRAEETFVDGDKVEALILGTLLEPSIQIEYSLHETIPYLGLFASLSYAYALSNSIETYVNAQKISNGQSLSAGDENTLNSNTQVDALSAESDISGLVLSVGASINF